MSRIDTIAVVDDDESVREAMSKLLRLLGYSAASFASAEDFLRSDRSRDVSCLITDVQMPGMSGVELQSRLISDGNLMPVIFVTAYPEEALRDRVLKNGALAYLTKPLHEESLISCLDQALKHPNSEETA